MAARTLQHQFPAIISRPVKKLDEVGNVLRNLIDPFERFRRATAIAVNDHANLLDGLQLPVLTDSTRGSPGTKGRLIFNDDDGQLNVDDGTNWTLPDGTTT